MNRSITIILKLTATLAFSFRADNAHWNSKTGGPQHGPQVWPWWHLFSLSLLKLFQDAPKLSIGSGRRLWFYTRWGAIYFDFVLDRRGEVKKRLQWSVSKWS